MKQCPKCGKGFSDENAYCDVCGVELTEAPRIEEQPSAQPEVAEKKEQKNKNNFVYACAYISWLVFVPLIEEHNSDFARFHCNQGIVISLFRLVISGVFALLTMLPWIIGDIFWYAEGVLLLACLVFDVIGIVGALEGKKTELPLIGKIKIID